MSDPGKLTSGTSPWKTLAGFLLWPLSIPYRAWMVVRRSWWRGRSHRLTVPVVSIGNLTCGGTGKTPMVEMVAGDLAGMGFHPAILSRGYGATGGEGAGHDEYRVLAENLPGIEHYQGADRVVYGQEAVAAGADVLVLDDGFQHCRLHRDLDLVLLDSLRPFDNGQLLPAGLLREPVTALKDADLLGLTRVNLVSREKLDSIRSLLAKRCPGIPLLEIESRAVCWQELYGEARDPGALAAAEVFAFCGIGNPHSFQLAVEDLGVQVAGFHAFKDHQAYDAASVAQVASRARQCGVDTVVMTQKDAVKLEEEWLKSQKDVRWFFLRIEQAVVSGEDAYRQALAGLFPGDR